MAVVALKASFAPLLLAGRPCPRADRFPSGLGCQFLQRLGTGGGKSQLQVAADERRLQLTQQEQKALGGVVFAQELRPGTEQGPAAALQHVGTGRLWSPGEEEGGLRRAEGSSPSPQLCGGSEGKQSTVRGTGEAWLSVEGCPKFGVSR